jgi:hypothetical protein
LNPIKYKIEKGRVYEEYDNNPDNTGWVDALLFNLKTFLYYDYKEIQKLKKCSICKKYFIARRNNPCQKFCPVCSRKNKMTPKERADYMKGYRANPIVVKRKREAKIKELMLNTGRTRKEVEASMKD